MYVYEEDVNGEKLTEIINKKHENVKYLPGVKLPENVVALADVRETVKDAHLLVFVMPHQFVKSLCRQMQGHLRQGAKAISLVKGFDCENAKINLISQYVRGILNIECCSLSGANVANDVAHEQFAETTIGYEDQDTAQVFQLLFDTPYFKVNAVPDVAGVELCGALKNIVALAAGFVDGLGLGSNTKAAIIRLGLLEMRRFAAMFYSGVIEETFWDSSGVADLITTCYGGRNRKCAEIFVKTRKSFKQIEKDELNGQKLQGTHTARDVYVFLTAQGKRQFFPLFTTVYEISDAGSSPDRIVKVFMTPYPRPVVKAQGTSPVQLDEIVRSKL
jgi:glycerol-3-phosphate dehydrogenase (NAD+)